MSQQLTKTDREYLRYEIDVRRRQRLKPLQAAFAGIIFCSSCGMDLDDWTPGCGTCRERWRRWNEKSTDPYFHSRYEAMRANVKLLISDRVSKANSIRMSGKSRPNFTHHAGTWAAHSEALKLAGY